MSLSPTLKRMLFSLTGFAPPLIEASEQRADIELVDLHRLYHGA